MKRFALVLPALLLADAAFSCTPIRPKAATIDTVKTLNSRQSSILTSPNQHFFLKLVPSKWALEKGRLVKKRDSYGLAFEAMPYGQIKQLWSFKHWEGIKGNNRMYLADSGLNLITFNYTVRSNQDKSAVVTYYKGKVGKAYSPYDLGVTQPIRKSTCGTGSWVNYTHTNNLNIHTVNNVRWGVNTQNMTIKRK